MAAGDFQFFDEMKNYLGSAVFNFTAHAFKVLLSNVAPVGGTNAVKADITDISAGNGYTAGGPALTTVTWTETVSGSGIWQFNSDAVTVTAAGGTIATFRYACLYDDTPTSPADPLLGYLDYGTGISLAAGQFFTINSGPWFQL